MMTPLTISALTAHIAALLERDEILRSVTVTGEVSAWKRAASGHVYFSLKDGGAAINAVMWRNAAASHGWLPGPGDQVVAFGYVGVYPERGAYQLYVNRLQPAGRGQLYAQFEALKLRLAEAGLFAAERKRPTPAGARRIGVVTSADAAALRDILRVLAARWPLAEVVLFSCLVQGGEAPGQIVAALEAANSYSAARRQAGGAPLDVLLLARGGGSIEDLWAFNDERVAWAIVRSALPVVTGVGHETDTTIADYVADLRAPTPTAAAAAVTLDRADIAAQLAELRRGLARRALALLAEESRHLAAVRRRLPYLHPRRQLDLRRQMLADRTARLHRAVRRHVAHAAERSAAVHRRLEDLSPTRVLARGYSIVRRDDGAVVTGPHLVQPGDALHVRAARGGYRVRVEPDANGGDPPP